MKKKKQQLKRIVTKRGQVQYYQGGKRVSDKKALQILSKKQKERSQKAKKSASELLYYKGKALPKVESFLLREKFKKQLESQKENRLDKLTTNGKKLFKSKAQFDRIYKQLYETQYDFFKPAENQRGKFKSGYEGRVVREGVKDVAFWLKESAFNDFKVIIYLSGGVLRGKVTALNYLATNETMILEYIVQALPNVGILARFFYSFEVGLNQRTIYINMAQEVPSVRDYVIEEVRKKRTTLQPYADLRVDLYFSV